MMNSAAVIGRQLRQQAVSGRNSGPLQQAQPVFGRHKPRTPAHALQPLRPHSPAPPHSAMSTTAGIAGGGGYDYASYGYSQPTAQFSDRLQVLTGASYAADGINLLTAQRDQRELVAQLRKAEMARGQSKLRCTWHCCCVAFKALSGGLILLLLGSIMSAIGFLADANLQEQRAAAAAVAAENAQHSTTLTTAQSDSTMAPEEVNTQIRNLTLAGPVIMGLGGIVIVAALVLTFEVRDTLGVKQLAPAAQAEKKFEKDTQLTVNATTQEDAVEGESKMRKGSSRRNTLNKSRRVRRHTDSMDISTVDQSQQGTEEKTEDVTKVLRKESVSQEPDQQNILQELDVQSLLCNPPPLSKKTSYQRFSKIKDIHGRWSTFDCGNLNNVGKEHEQLELRTICTGSSHSRASHSNAISMDSSLHTSDRSAYFASPRSPVDTDISDTDACSLNVKWPIPKCSCSASPAYLSHSPSESLYDVITPNTSNQPSTSRGLLSEDELTSIMYRPSTKNTDYAYGDETTILMNNSLLNEQPSTSNTLNLENIPWNIRLIEQQRIQQQLILQQQMLLKQQQAQLDRLLQNKNNDTSISLDDLCSIQREQSESSVNRSKSKTIASIESDGLSSSCSSMTSLSLGGDKQSRSNSSQLLKSLLLGATSASSDSGRASDLTRPLLLDDNNNRDAKCLPLQTLKLGEHAKH